MWDFLCLNYCPNSNSLAVVFHTPILSTFPKFTLWPCTLHSAGTVGLHMECCAFHPLIIDGLWYNNNHASILPLTITLHSSSAEPVRVHPGHPPQDCLFPQLRADGSHAGAHFALRPHGCLWIWPGPPVSVNHLAKLFVLEMFWSSLEITAGSF